MNTARACRWFSFAILAFGVPPLCAAEPGAIVSPAAVAEFRRNVTLLGSFQERIWQTDRDKRQPLGEECLHRFDADKVQAGTLAGDTLAYYRGRLLLVAGRTAEARQCFVELSGRRDVGIFPILSLSETEVVAGSATPLDRKLRRCLGDLLPVSGWGTSNDNAKGELKYDAEGREDIPSLTRISRDGFVRIAELFAGMGFQEATEYYREAILGRHPPPWVLSDNPRWDGMLSWAASPVWLKLSKEEWHQGRRAAAFESLARAIVWCHSEQKEAAFEQLRCYEDSLQDPVPTAPEKPHPDAASIREIALLWAKVNMHPRAIELVAAHKALLGPDGEVLLQTLQGEWDGVVKAAWAGMAKLYIFGQPATPGAKITIPLPQREETLRQVHDTLVRLTSPGSNAGGNVPTGKK